MEEFRGTVKVLILQEHSGVIFQQMGTHPALTLDMENIQQGFLEDNGPMRLVLLLQMETMDSTMVITDSTMEITVTMDSTMEIMVTMDSTMGITDSTMEITDSTMEITDSIMEITDSTMEITETMDSILETTEIMNGTMEITDSVMKTMEIMDSTMGSTMEILETMDLTVEIMDSILETMEIMGSIMETMGSIMDSTTASMTETPEIQHLLSFLTQTAAVTVDHLKAPSSLEIATPGQAMATMEAMETLVQAMEAMNVIPQIQTQELPTVTAVR